VYEILEVAQHPHSVFWCALPPHHDPAGDAIAGIDFDPTVAQVVGERVNDQKAFYFLGVTASYLPDELLATLKSAADEVLGEIAAEDAHFDAVLRSQRAFQDPYREWRRLAYLPKDFQ